MLTFLKENRWPLAIAAAATLIRIIYLLELSRLPDFAVPMIDEKWHWEWANEIISKSFWGEGAYFRAPVYPYFLALLSWITGASILWSKLLQVLVCGGTAWFIFKLTEKIFDHRAAILAGCIYAFYGMLIFYETMFLIPVLFLCLCVWGVYRITALRESSSWKSWLITGLILGLAAISRPNVLLVVPFLLIWLFFTASRKMTLLKRTKVPLVLLCGILAAILPVTVRNALVTGEFILISSQGGINLYLGNNPEADGLTMLMPEVALDESVTWRQFPKLTRVAAEREAGRSLSEAEQSAFWTDKAIQYITHHPEDFLDLVWKKTAYLFSGFENSDNLNIYHHRAKSRLYSILLFAKPIYFPFGLLLPLTLAGLYITRREYKRLAPLYIFLVAYTPSIVLFLVTARHRLPLIPFMIVISSGGLMVLLRTLRQLSVRQLALAMALFLIPLVGLNRTFYEAGSDSEFQFRLNEGIRYEKLNDYSRAEQAYLAADRDFPYSATLVNNLAHVQTILGKLDAADRNFRRALSLDPDYATAYNNFGILMRKKNHPDSALLLFHEAMARYDSVVAGASGLSQIQVNMADCYLDMGRTDSAESLYWKAIDTDPQYPKAYFSTAVFYARIATFHRSDSLFRTGQQFGEPSAAELFNWGLSYFRRKEYTSSLDKMLQVIELDSTFYQAYYCIAAAYHENLFPDDSVNKYLDATLRINASFPPALELKKIVSGRQ